MSCAAPPKRFRGLESRAQRYKARGLWSIYHEDGRVLRANTEPVVGHIIACVAHFGGDGDRRRRVPGANSLRGFLFGGRHARAVFQSSFPSRRCASGRGPDRADSIGTLHRLISDRRPVDGIDRFWSAPFMFGVGWLGLTAINAVAFRETKVLGGVDNCLGMRCSRPTVSGSYGRR